MGNRNIGHRTVKLDHVKQNNIVLVDLGRKSEESVFEQEYRKAAHIIDAIVCKNRTEADECGRRTGGARKCSGQWTDFQTAVPFIGDRGTGKTSVMCSVLERLRNYQGHSEEAAFSLGKDNNDVRFIAFDMIDANTLKSSEDIMEIILARMLAYLEELQTDCDYRDSYRQHDAFRELYRQIDELYKELSLVYWKKADAREEYDLTNLQRIADSQKAITGFRQLVQMFTEEVGRYQFKNKTCYLVIALDDIDMYQGGKHGLHSGQFALLEHIYTHMRIPNLIVLMTYNEHILKRRCNRHFEEIYFGSEKTKGYAPTEREDIEALTGQFMSKLFPQEQRIYLPNYMFIDSANQPKLYVSPVQRNSQGEMELITPFKSEAELTVKEFMLRLIAHKTGVYFDAAGTKKHFFEPRNLREFGELFQVISAMEEVKDNDMRHIVRRRNRQELLNYMHNQFALRHLDSEEYRQFRSLSAIPLVRQSRTLVDNIRQQRKSVVGDKDNPAFLAKAKRDRWRYSYGELLHNIYHSTRIPKKAGSEESYFSKAFIHCILGVHSVVMTQSVRMLEDRDIMMELMGSSIAGRWADSMLPDFSFDGRRPVAGGSVSLPVSMFFGWELPFEFSQWLPILGQEYTGEYTESCIRDCLEALVITGMFFTGFPAKGLQIAMEPQKMEDGRTALFLNSASKDHICFNVMNFAINLYNALPDPNTDNEGYLTYICNKLKKLGSAYAERVTTDWAAYRRGISGKSEQATDSPRGKGKSYASPQRVEQYFDRKKIVQLQKEQIDAWEAYVKGTEIMETEFSVERFVEKWDAAIDSIYAKFCVEIEQWQAKHTSFPVSLPIQNFDMMYNIIKRLASVYYHDIPEEVPADEIYDYYVILYESVVEELEAQDRIYFKCGEKSFADAFRDTVFYKVFTAQKGFENPCVEEILVAMMHTALIAKDAREKINIHFPLVPAYD